MTMSNDFKLSCCGRQNCELCDDRELNLWDTTLSDGLGDDDYLDEFEGTTGTDWLDDDDFLNNLGPVPADTADELEELHWSEEDLKELKRQRDEYAAELTKRLNDNSDR